jgi:DNA-binding CsgD family transcriptional regulator
LKSLPGAGGAGSKLNLYVLNNITIICVCLFNLFKGIATNKPLAGYFIYVLPFFILFTFNTINQLKKWYKGNAILYAVLGIGTLLGNEPANYSGAIFIIYSFYIFNSFRTNIVLFSVVFISIVAKNIFHGIDVNNTINLIISYAFTFSIYYILIHPKPKPERKILFCPHLDEKDLIIVEKLSQSYIHKQIAPLVGLNPGAVSRRISRMYEKLGVHSAPGLVAKCLELGYIKRNVDK